MAATALGDRLTEAHTTAQAILQRRVQADLLTLWPLLDPADIDGTFPLFYRAASALIAKRKQESAATAAAYYRAFRTAEGVDAPFQMRMMADLAQEQALTSLLVTGPVTFKTSRGAGLDEETSMRRALVSTIGSGSRLAAQGGRDTIIETMRHDEASYGVARVARGGSCSFCAMLASRGPVYKSEVTGGFRAHDHCHCSTEVVYDAENYRWPGGATQRALADLWKTTTEGFSGRDAENAFRRAYERPHLHLL